MTAKIGSTQSEDCGVHGSLEEEQEKQDNDCSLALSRNDHGVEDNGEDGVDHEQEVCLEDGRESSRDETANSERDQSIGEHVGRLGRAEGRVLGGIIDEEGSDGNLSSDVAKLGNEAEDHVVLLVERTLSDLISELIESEILYGSGRIQHLLGNLRELGNKEEDGNSNTSTGDC